MPNTSDAKENDSLNNLIPQYPTEKISSVPNIRYYTSQISDYGKAGQPEKAQEIFDQMPKEGVKPNEFH